MQKRVFFLQILVAFLFLVPANALQAGEISFFLKSMESVQKEIPFPSGILTGKKFLGVYRFSTEGTRDHWKEVKVAANGTKIQGGLYRFINESSSNTVPITIKENAEPFSPQMAFVHPVNDNGDDHSNSTEIISSSSFFEYRGNLKIIYDANAIGLLLKDSWEPTNIGLPKTTLNVSKGFEYSYTRIVLSSGSSISLSDLSKISPIGGKEESKPVAIITFSEDGYPEKIHSLDSEELQNKQLYSTQPAILISYLENEHAWKKTAFWNNIAEINKVLKMTLQ